MKPFCIPEPLTKWIKLHTGIETTPVNRGRVELAVQELAVGRGLAPERYVGLLLEGRLDAQELIDRVTTAESFFLRHRSSMAFVVSEVVPGLLKQNVRPRILSIPCARGEEPYSLAMMLMDSGIRPHRVSITGVDISRNCIALARQGVFEPYSFRRVGPDFQQRHFVPADKRFRVNPVYAEAVSFERLNVLMEAEQKLLPGFHVIFCQNLLIYFDEETSTHLMDVLERLLAPEGWLFVDSSEGPRARERFHRHPAGNMFGFRKNPHAGEQRKPVAETDSTARRSGQVRSPFRKTNTRIRPSTKPVNPGSRNPPGAVPVSRAGKHGAGPTLNVQKAAASPADLREAEAAYSRKDLEQAARAYMGLVDAGSRFCAKALLGLSLIHADQGNTLEALEYAESALNKNTRGDGAPLSRKEEAEAHAVIGLSMHGRGLPSAAEEHFVRLRTLDPTHPALRVATTSEAKGRDGMQQGNPVEGNTGSWPEGPAGGVP